MKAAGATGAASVMTLKDLPALASNETIAVPTRPFGKTGIKVPILGFGTSLHVAFSQLLLKQAVKWGVTYWDTADSYGWGNNEKAIGKYFSKFPDHRPKLFLVTKAATSNPKKLTDKLNQSLQRMNTSYIDLYFISYVKWVEKELTNEKKGVVWFVE